MKELLTFLFLACCTITSAQDTIRVCTYNVLNYSKTNEDGSSERFERILREINPDVLLVQEMVDTTGIELLGRAYQKAVNAEISYSNFLVEWDTDCVIFYKSQRFFVPNNANIHRTELRSIIELRLTELNSKEMIRFFVAHLKAGDNQDDEVKRLAEVDSLRKAMSPNFTKATNTIVAGDFNIYRTAEPAYVQLTFPPMNDPLGGWMRDSPNYLSYYTQSPRMVANATCGGGVGGGMDDRFDFILFNDKLKDNYIEVSYTVFGNDGLDRRNSPINSPPNVKVSAEIANDLFCVSDHLPVYADFVLGQTTGVEFPGFVHKITFSETAEYVNVLLPSSSNVTVTNFNVTVTNILGQTVQVINGNGGNQYVHKARFAPGMYFIQVSAAVDTERVVKCYKFVKVN